jgi:hypothetical protein
MSEKENKNQTTNRARVKIGSRKQMILFGTK